jgi:phosphate transport system substrate-binding protein
MKKRLSQLLVAVLAVPVIATSVPSGASAAKLNDTCKRKDLFEVEKVGNTFIRCMVKPGSSLHAKKPKRAEFTWQRTTKKQFDYSRTKTNTAIRIDGSSTVYPLMAVAAKYFEATTSGQTDISIGISGTGGGMQKFCNNEIDMANASRAMSSTEKAACAAKGITYTEVLVANDGLAVVVNPKNPLTCITMDQLKNMWKPASGTSGVGSATNWGDVIPGNTLGALKLFGAGSDSGTFDSFNTFVHGRSTTSRTDYQATENDNVTVKGVAGSNAGIGYYGLSYAVENAKTNKALEIDKGAGCVKPTAANVQNGTYAMARPLYTYIKNSSATSIPAIKKFMEFYLDNSKIIGDDALFVPLTRAQRGTAVAAVRSIK